MDHAGCSVAVPVRQDMVFRRCIRPPTAAGETRTATAVPEQNMGTKTRNTKQLLKRKLPQKQGGQATGCGNGHQRDWSMDVQEALQENRRRIYQRRAC